MTMTLKEFINQYVEKSDLELVYIKRDTLRFLYGRSYKIVKITEEVTTILDKDGHMMYFSNDILSNYFTRKDKWRDEQVAKILNDTFNIEIQ